MAKNSNNKKKAAVVSIATAASLGVLLSNTFNSPKDLVNNRLIDEQREDISKIDYEKSRKADAKLQWLEKVPVSIRTCIGIPLWALGNLILSVLTPLWTLAGQPLLQFVLSWLVTAAVVMCVITLAAKILFPEMPLKKLINKKSIVYSLVGTLVYLIVDKVLAITWKGYRSFKFTLRFVFGLAIVTIALVPFIRKKMEQLKKPEIIYEEI